MVQEVAVSVIMEIRRLERLDAAHVSALSALLIDCVDGGASVGFMSPLTQERAGRFWLGIGDRIAAGLIELLVAERDGVVMGTVQLIMAQPENQPHRADLAKMLVHRGARRQGVGERLVRAAEDHARSAGKTLLVLDTVTGSDGDRLYRRLGWIAVGCVPLYALFPDGRPCSTTIFYRQLLAG